MPARTISGLSQGPGITSPSSSTSIPSTSGIKINHLAESRWRSELDVEDTQDVI